MRNFVIGLALAAIAGGSAAATPAKGPVYSHSKADAAGLRQMGIDAGLSGKALDAFVRNGGTNNLSSLEAPPKQRKPR